MTKAVTWAVTPWSSLWPIYPRSLDWCSQLAPQPSGISFHCPIDTCFFDIKVIIILFSESVRLYLSPSFTFFQLLSRHSWDSHIHLSHIRIWPTRSSYLGPPAICIWKNTTHTCLLKKHLNMVVSKINQPWKWYDSTQFRSSPLNLSFFTNLT